MGCSSLRKVLFILVLILFAYGLARLYYKVTDDFRLANISYEIPFNKEWEIPPLSFQDQELLNLALDQNYTYITKGSQSYVFISDDGKYVLKFFKFKHLRPSWFLKYLTFPPFDRYAAAEKEKKDKLLGTVFSGYRLAYEMDKEDSALIYVHLNLKEGTSKKIAIIDKTGFRRILDIGRYPFILQYKAVTTRDLLKQLLDQKNSAEAKRRIRQIIDLYLSEYQKGIYDRDHGLKTNTGFVGAKAIRIDMGKLTYDPNYQKPEIYKADFTLVILKFSKWLERAFPVEYPELAQDMEQKLSEIFGEKFVLPRS